MNILITGALKNESALFTEIENLGYDIFYQQQETDELIIDPKLIDIVICNSFFLYHNIEEFINLKVIQLTSVGLDRVPINYIKEKKIKLFNAKGVYSIPMAEFTIMGILQLYKGAYNFFENQKFHRWKKNRNILELSNKCVAILGVGSVGKEIAKRLRGFNTINIGFDIKSFVSEYFDVVLNITDFDKYIKQIDILICCLPLNDQTKFFINKERICLLKNNTIVINISRGKIIDEDALYLALHSGKLLGAVIDVFEKEPLDKNSKLWDLKNIIITPHNSFVSNANQERISKIILNNLESIIKL